MENDIKVSVAMATYDGEKYIKEQIDSILSNMRSTDELVISDDGSTDKTIEIISNYNDKRIKIFEGPRNGVKKNFENAIRLCDGDYIFLADQDDIWEKNKIEEVMNVFKNNSKVSLIVHDAIVFESDSKEVLIESFFKFRKSSSGFIKNVIKNSYIGCCMAFSKELKKYILDIPDDIEMHDQWIGIINDIYLEKAYFLKQKLIRYRRHQNNVSELKHYPFYKMLVNRIKFLKEIVKRGIK